MRFLQSQASVPFLLSCFWMLLGIRTAWRTTSSIAGLMAYCSEVAAFHQVKGWPHGIQWKGISVDGFHRQKESDTTSLTEVVSLSQGFTVAGCAKMPRQSSLVIPFIHKYVQGIYIYIYCNKVMWTVVFAISAPAKNPRTRHRERNVCHMPCRWYRMFSFLGPASRPHNLLLMGVNAALARRCHNTNWSCADFANARPTRAVSSLKSWVYFSICFHFWFREKAPMALWQPVYSPWLSTKVLGGQDWAFAQTSQLLILTQHPDEVLAPVAWRYHLSCIN